MLRYIGKRILSLIPVMIVVSFVAFLIVYMIPGGPASSILGLEATADEIHDLNAQLGFDRPFLSPYTRRTFFSFNPFARAVWIKFL